MIPITPEIELLTTENYSLQHEKAHIQNAIAEGFEIVRNTNNLLTFDLDGEEALEVFKSRVGFLERKGFEPVITITKSKSSNYHAVVTICSSMTIPESIAIAIQACLGSDWKREMLGVLRQLNGQKDQVSLLFRPKELEIIAWP